MRVLFIQSSIGSSEPSRFEQGIASIAAALTSYHHTCGLASIDSWDMLPSLYKKINDFRPDLIGFSATTTTFDSVRRMSRLIKNRHQSIMLVCGGVHVTLYPEDIRKAPHLDAICRGDGEYALLEYIQGLENGDGSHYKTKGLWTRKGKRIFKNANRIPISDLDTLPFPDRDMFLSENRLYPRFDKYRILEFIFTRGCPFFCTYCSNNALNKFSDNRNFRFMTPERAIAEIEDAISKYACDKIQIHDDTFTSNKSWLYAFLKLYKERIGIPFSCNTRVDQITKDLLVKMKESGCVSLSYGIESGDEFLSNNVLKRRITNHQLTSAFILAKEVGIKTFAYVMIGFPRESPNKFVNTIKLVGRLKPDEFVLYIFHPYPGTELYDICIKEKLIRVKPKNYIERTDTVLDIPTFQRKDIFYFYNNFNFLVNLLRQQTNSPVVNFCQHILFYLAVKPPSDGLYVPAQLLLSLGRTTAYWLRYLKRVFTLNN